MTPTTDLQKILDEATKGPWKQGATLTTAQTRRWSAAQMQANDAVEKQRVFANFNFGDEGRSRVFIAETHAEANARLIAIAPDLAARVLELEDQNARLRSLLVHVENADYDHTVSGNENFARLQEIASAGLEDKA